MDELFSTGGIRGMKLLDFMQWVEQSVCRMANKTLAAPTYGILALPPVQRTPVWRPRQIVDLWDTVLRGLPIGSLYLVKRKPDAMARGYSVESHNAQVGAGWDLLDGQQRTRVLLLGLRGPSAEDKRCLWIDLAAPSLDRSVSLYLTSESQPFGYQLNGEKLGIEERKKARLEIEPVENDPIRRDGRPAYGYEFFMGFIDNNMRPKGTLTGWQPGWPPLPYKAKRGEAAFVPLHILFGEWRKGASGEARRQKLRDAAVSASANSEIIEKLNDAFVKLDEAEIALLRVGVDKEDLLLLFDRIGAAGSPLTGEERLFSIYKYHEPLVHDAVIAIYGDKQIGHVLPPVKIAACAIRIAYALSHEQTNEGNSLPDIATFAKEMTSGALQGKLKWILPVAHIKSEEIAYAQGELADAFRILFETLGYAGGSDPGIPKIMRTRLSPNLIHILLLRILIARQPVPLNIADSREDLIRFVLFWGLCINNEDKASARCFEKIRSTFGKSTVSLKTLYRELVDSDSDPVALPITRPDALRAILVHSPGSPDWRGWEKRFDPTYGLVVIELAKRWWMSNEKSLMWLQRDYLDDKFKAFDPSSGRDDETPYDVDHIVPKADWGQNWSPVRSRFAKDKVLDESQLNQMQHSRWHLGDCIGNKWLVDFSSNRSWGDGDWDGKLSILLSNGSLDPSEKDAWTNAWGVGKEAKERAWPKERLITFQEAIERRAAWLYERFYTEAGFSHWEDADGDLSS